MPSSRFDVARVLACAATLATFLAPSTAHAQQRGYAVNRFEPSERGSEWFASESLDFRGDFRPALGVVGDYSHQALAIYKPDGDLRSAIVDHNLLVHVGAALVLAERLRLAANLPLQLYTTGDAGTLHGVTFAPPQDGQGIGDLRFSADVRLLGAYDGPFRAAIGASLWLPTGDRAQYMSDGEIRLAPHALVAGDIGMFAYAGRLGFNYHSRSETFAGSPIGSELQLTASAGVRFVDRKLLIGPELFGTTYTEDPFKTRSTPLEIALGAHYTTSSGIRFGAGVGTGLTRGYGAPAIRALLNIEWAPAVETDRDHDGILDGDDACPDVAGIHTDDPKTNGCPAPPPPPPDRDHDGVLDQDDACVDVPGVKTDNPKTNGCPPDRDQDGIIDSQDACPDEKGPPNANPMLNGCPDTDGDGVFDPDDVCPNEPGLKTTDPKTNGCPDPDRDKDGIVNEQDACPDEPGKADPDPKRNGCPKAFVQAGQIKILDQVKFKTNSADILPGKDSEEVLQAVLKVLNEHSEIKKVRIEGHTDSTGSAALNRTLSANRAKSVMKWLTGHGIAADRLTSAGFGPDKPIDDNATPAGRQNNRRVEFHIEQ